MFKRILSLLSGFSFLVSVISYQLSVIYFQVSVFWNGFGKVFGNGFGKRLRKTVSGNGFGELLGYINRPGWDLRGPSSLKLGAPVGGRDRLGELKRFCEKMG